MKFVKLLCYALLYITLVCIGNKTQAQTVNATKVNVKGQIVLNGKIIDSISVDVALANNSNTHVPSVAALKAYIQNLLFQAKTTFTGGTSATKDSVNGLITVKLSTAGTTTLVAGTKAISIPGLTASSIAWFQVTNQNTAGSTIQYSANCTTNTLTIKALTSAGNNTINTADVSTGNYFIKPN